MTEAVTDDNGCVEEGGDAENHAHDKYDEEEDLLTVTADGAAHLVTDAVIVDDDVAVEEGVVESMNMRRLSNGRCSSFRWGHYVTDTVNDSF